MRPYYNYDDRGEGGGFGISFGSGWTKTVKILILTNAVAFVVVLLLRGQFGEDEYGLSVVDKWVGLYRPYLLQGAAWQLVTYMFVHGGLWHLFGNMLGLYIFGGDIERHLGTKGFLLMYFLCGLGGAVLSLLQWGHVVPLIGASGGVLGVLVAFALFFPQARIILFPIPIPIRARTIAILWAFVTVVGVVGQANDGIGHLAHLGGMAVAYVFVKGRPLGHSLARFWKARRDLFRQRRSAAEQAELDRILDKVHRGGIASLSNPERDFLNLMSRKYRGED